jgi:hypothetical protein
MIKNGAMNGEPESSTEKGKRRGCRTVLLVFILIFCGNCLLSILAHTVAKLDTQTGVAAEICIGETYYEGDPGPIKRQGIWVASPFLPYFSGRPMSSVTTHKLICGVIPWSPRLPNFTMLVIRPFGIYSP